MLWPAFVSIHHYHYHLPILPCLVLFVLLPNFLILPLCSITSISPHCLAAIAHLIVCHCYVPPTDSPSIHPSTMERAPTRDEAAHMRLRKKLLEKKQGES